MRDNEFDLAGSPHWGVEIASSDRVTVEANDFRGDGSDKDSAISMNSGSSDATITDNMVAQVGTLVDLSGDGHRITGNCLDQVGHEYAYRSSGGGNIEFARNGACVAGSAAPGASGGAAD